MIAGATYTLPIDIQYPLGNVSKVIVTLKNETTQQKILKNYPNDNETYLMSDGRLGVRLSQQDTISLVGNVKVEAQINLASGAVAKTETKRVFVSPTLHTEIVDGAEDNGENLLDGVTLKLGAPITVVVEGSEGTSFQPGNALELKDGILNVLTTDDAEQGNNLPITSEGARKLADNISYNDLKDRPFYEEDAILFEGEVASSDLGGFFADVTSISINLLDGEQYTVIFDGVRYECEAKSDHGLTYIGDTHLFYQDGETPVIPFAYMTDKNSFFLFVTEAVGVYSVTIAGKQYHTLKSEYLPVATDETYGVVCFGSRNGAVRHIDMYFDATYEEVEEACKAFRNGNVLWTIAGDVVLSITGNMDLTGGLVCNVDNGNGNLVVIKGNSTDGITYMEREWNTTLILRSPSGQIWKITVTDEGTLNVHA